MDFSRLIQSVQFFNGAKPCASLLPASPRPRSRGFLRPLAPVALGVKALAISASVASMTLASVASASEVVAESRLQGWPRDQSRFPFSLSFAFQKKKSRRARMERAWFSHWFLIGS